MKKGVVKKEISEKVDEVKKAVYGGFFQKLFFTIRILISLAIGLLPSFLFIALFIQYGSPLTNYLNFLMKFSASWGAWVSAIFISFIINFLNKIRKSKDQVQKILKNKLLLIGILLVILVFITLIITQLYLYLNFTLRNDILIRVSADKDNLFFTNNSAEDINFKISVLMNPFCSAQCEYKFDDISNRKIIDEGKLNITSVFSKVKNYTIENEHLIRGSQVLNTFEISCVSKKTFFCYTSELESKRTILVTANYDLTPEELEFKNYSRGLIVQLGETLFSVRMLLNQSAGNINFVNNSFSNNFSAELTNLEKKYSSMNDSFSGVENLWKMQGFDSLKLVLPEISKDISIFENDSKKLSNEILNNISFYNSLVDNLSNSETRLNEIYQLGPSESDCNELNRLVVNFNNVLDYFENQSNLTAKNIAVQNILSQINFLYTKLKLSSETSSCILNNNINAVNFLKISVVPPISAIPEIILEESIPLCCFKGKCEKCCDEKCADENYPVIFLHGQSINKALPTDYSLDSFTLTKKKLTEENYIDVGAVVISSINEPRGLWGKINASVMMTASYFFDTYKTADGEQTVSSNEDNIDTYAIRLRKIIDLVKYRTNKNKVIIVAHSMGGVVARRYIQIFGGENIDHAILITVPNHGTSDKVAEYCGVIGPEASCNDLNKDSIFMNELNNAPTDTVPTYNLIGIGCDMGDETGEGIVKNSSQYLDYATNYYIKGTCNELNFDFFHESIVFPDRYPEAYNLIKELLKKKD